MKVKMSEACFQDLNDKYFKACEEALSSSELYTQYHKACELLHLNEMPILAEMLTNQEAAKTTITQRMQLTNAQCHPYVVHHFNQAENKIKAAAYAQLLSRAQTILHAICAQAAHQPEIFKAIKDKILENQAQECCQYLYRPNTPLTAQEFARLAREEEQVCLIDDNNNPLIVPGWMAFELLFKADFIPYDFTTEHLGEILGELEPFYLDRILSIPALLIFMSFEDLIFCYAQKDMGGKTAKDVFLILCQHVPQALFAERIYEFEDSLNLQEKKYIANELKKHPVLLKWFDQSQIEAMQKTGLVEAIDAEQPAVSHPTQDQAALTFGKKISWVGSILPSLSPFTTQGAAKSKPQKACRMRRVTTPVSRLVHIEDQFQLIFASLQIDKRPNNRPWDFQKYSYTWEKQALNTEKASASNIFKASCKILNIDPLAAKEMLESDPQAFIDLKHRRAFLDRAERYTDPHRKDHTYKTAALINKAKTALIKLLVEDQISLDILLNKDVEKCSYEFTLRKQYNLHPYDYIGMATSLQLTSICNHAHGESICQAIPGYMAFYLLLKAGSVPPNFTQEHFRRIFEVKTQADASDQRAWLLKKVLSEDEFLVFMDTQTLIELSVEATNMGLLSIGKTVTDIFLYFYHHHPEALYETRIRRFFKFTDFDQNKIRVLLQEQSQCPLIGGVEMVLKECLNNNLLEESSIKAEKGKEKEREKGKEKEEEKGNEDINSANELKDAIELDKRQALKLKKKINLAIRGDEEPIEISEKNKNNKACAIPLNLQQDNYLAWMKQHAFSFFHFRFKHIYHTKNGENRAIKLLQKINKPEMSYSAMKLELEKYYAESSIRRHSSSRYLKAIISGIDLKTMQDLSDADFAKMKTSLFANKLRAAFISNIKEGAPSKTGFFSWFSLFPSYKHVLTSFDTIAKAKNDKDRYKAAIQYISEHPGTSTSLALISAIEQSNPRISLTELKK